MTRRGTAAMQVYLAASETQEWLRGEPSFQEDLMEKFTLQARQRGRKLIEVFANDGRKLVVYGV